MGEEVLKEVEFGDKSATHQRGTTTDLIWVLSQIILQVKDLKLNLLGSEIC